VLVAPADQLLLMRILRVVAGLALVDVLLALGLVGILVGVTLPQVTVGLDRARTRGAARYLAAQMALARTQAVGRASTVALRFQQDATGVILMVYVDGNGNGVRTSDISALIDVQVQPSVRLEDLYPGVVIGVPSDSPDAPVQVGASGILSFTPSGTATSGTVYLVGRDGSRFAVRVLGVTGRVRVLQFDAVSKQWVESL
jgi:Tfp pilus assembly protein FimT